MWASKSKQVAEYDYGGYQVVRFEPKAFKQRRPDGKGGWIWNLDGVERTLYRLSELRAADVDQFVFVPEGEKDVDRLRSWGKIATCNSGGAKKFPASKGVEFTNRRVVILPDQDNEGAEHAEQVRVIVSSHAREVRIVNLPGVKDISEWVAQGRTEAEFDKLVDAAPSMVLSSNVQTASLEPNFGLLVMTGPELLAGAVHLQDLPFLPLLSIDGYFVKGWSHLVSGYPRVGKTDLLLACCRQWLRMGERVLYITEEPVTIWQHRLKMWSGDWTNLQVAFGLGSDPEVLRKLAREGAATLVVVDALRNLLRLKDEKDNSEIARVVNPWVADARAAEKTLFLAHHQRKGGGEHGEGISGGHALMGAFDIPIEVLWDPSKGTNRRLVRTYPRLIEAKEGLYEKVADGEFEYVGDPQAVALFEVTDKAKSLLTDVWQSTDEIWAGMDEPKPSKEQVRKALTDLAKQKVALRDPSIDSGPARGRTHRWRRPDAGSSEASATGSELSSNDTVYTLEPNSGDQPPKKGAFSDADLESEEMKAAKEAEEKQRRRTMFK